MTTYYVAHGNTTDGDGLGSADQATTGAWNDLEDVLDPAGSHYASLTSGDILYVRSVDASDNDITITDAEFDIALGVQVIIDDGTVWATSGQITYEFTDAASTNTMVDIEGQGGQTAGEPTLWAEDNNLKFHWTSTFVRSSGVKAMFYFEADYLYIKGVTFQYDTHASNGTYTTFFQFNGNATVFDAEIALFENCTFNLDRASTDAANYLIDSYQYRGCRTITFDYCDFTLPSSVTGTKTLFETYGSAGRYNYEFNYCTFTGSNNNIKITPVHDGNNYGGVAKYTFNYCTCDVEKLIPDITPRVKGSHYGAQFIARNFANDLSAFFQSDGWCHTMYQASGGYPYLDAFNAEGDFWVVRSIPQAIMERGFTRVLEISTFVTDVTALNNFNLEFLLHSSYSNDDTYNWWVVLTYTNTSGGISTTTTKAASAGTTLTSSTASWSSTTYAGNSYNKYKITPAIPGDIQVDRRHILTLYTSDSSVGSAYSVFVNPLVTLV